MMYLAVIDWYASSREESENNPGSNGSMPASVVDELFDSIRSLERNLSGMPVGMLQV